VLKFINFDTARNRQHVNLGFRIVLDRLRVAALVYVQKHEYGLGGFKKIDFLKQQPKTKTQVRVRASTVLVLVLITSKLRSPMANEAVIRTKTPRRWPEQQQWSLGGGV
jgi:hypothetical protein